MHITAQASRSPKWPIPYHTIYLNVDISLPIRGSWTARMAAGWRSWIVHSCKHWHEGPGHQQGHHADIWLIPRLTPTDSWAHWLVVYSRKPLLATGNARNCRRGADEVINLAFWCNSNNIQVHISRHGDPRTNQQPRTRVSQRPWKAHLPSVGWRPWEHLPVPAPVNYHPEI